MPNVSLLGLEKSVYTRIARMTLEEKGVDYVLKEVDIFADGGPPASYLRQHPFGRIPCLIHDESCIYETRAITTYIDEGFTGPALQPTDAALRARMNQVVGVLDAYAYRPMVWDVFVQRIVVPEEGGLPDEAVISGALPGLGIVLDELDRWLGAEDYLVGPSMTLADLHAFPMLVYFGETPEGGALLEEHQRIVQWFDRMKSSAGAKISTPWNS